MNRYDWLSAVRFILTILLCFALVGCSSGKIKHGLVQYLDNRAASKISILDSDYEKNSQAAQQIGPLQAVLDDLKSRAADLSGYWFKQETSSDVRMTRLPAGATVGLSHHQVPLGNSDQDLYSYIVASDPVLSRIYVPALKEAGYEVFFAHMTSAGICIYAQDTTGKLYSGSRGLLQGEDLLVIAGAITGIPQFESKLSWAQSCATQLSTLKEAKGILADLRIIWNTNYRDWKVSKSQKGVYIITGYGLGLQGLQPCIGKWYFYENSGDAQPADSYAQTLLGTIEK